MNKKRKNISVKNSFWKTYGRIIIEITKIVIESIVELLWIPFLIGTGACIAYLLTDLFNMDNYDDCYNCCNSTYTVYFIKSNGWN